MNSGVLPLFCVAVRGRAPGGTRLVMRKDHKPASPTQTWVQTPVPGLLAMASALTGYHTLVTHNLRA